MARLLAFASLLLLATPNLAYLQLSEFQVLNDPNDPFDPSNHNCIKPGHQNMDQLVKQYHKFFSEPNIDANSSVINHLLEVASELRNDSTELLPHFEKTFQMDGWKNFTRRQLWIGDAMNCAGNLIVADEISVTLLAIRDGIIPAVRPPYVSFGYLVPLSIDYVKVLVQYALEDMKTGKLVDQYFTTGEPSKQDVLNQLSHLQTIVNAFKVEFQKAVGAVYNHLLEQGLVLWPEDEAMVRAYTQKAPVMNKYIDDFRKKFTANLI